MRRFKIAIAALIAFLGFSYLIISSFRESSVYYMKVGELLSSSQPPTGRVKVEGDVVQGSLRKGDMIEFEITDGRNRIRVVYGGEEIPPTFREGAPVIVEGRYWPEGKFFEAKRIITKCPSKYEAKGEKDDR